MIRGAILLALVVAAVLAIPVRWDPAIRLKIWLEANK